MAFLQCREAVERVIRGNAPALSKAQISQVISFARISLIVGLVFLHYQRFPDSDNSPFVGMEVAQHPVASFVNSFALFFFFSVVPLLSMVSGWLFFSFDANTAAASLRQRMRRRITSLYLPLVVWNAMFLAVLALLFVWHPNHPLLAEMNIHFDSARLPDYVNAIFAVTRHPVGFQFWFVRDLLVTALISPLLWLSLRHTPYLGMAVLGVAWLIGNNLVIFFRTDVAFFFYLGGFVRLRQIPLHIGRKTAWWLLLAYLGVVTLRTLAPLALDLSSHRPELLTAATRAMRLLGVVACWSIFLQLALTRVGAIVAGYGGLAFFLHAAHYPLLAEVKILLWHLVPAQTDGWLIAHYLASVTITVTIGMGAGVLLSRKAPSWFALMNGGRPGMAPPVVAAEPSPPVDLPAAPESAPRSPRPVASEHATVETTALPDPLADPLATRPQAD